MGFKHIKRMLFGIAILIYALAIRSESAIANIGLIIVFSGVFYDEFNGAGIAIVKYVNQDKKSE